MYYNVYNPYYSTELYHHGILGQKWGIRRYQYEDGSLTPEGKKRYYKNGYDEKGGYTRAGERWKKKNERRQEKENNKKNSWYNSLTEDQKKKFKKTMAIAGAITIAAAAMYVTPRVMRFVAANGDDIIKAGETYGHVGGRAIDPLDKKLLYIAKGKDRTKYKGIWAPTKAEATDYELKAFTDIKFAGKKSAGKIFEDYAKTLSDTELENMANRMRGKSLQWGVAGGAAQSIKSQGAADNIDKYLRTKDSKYLRKAYEGININFTSEGHPDSGENYLSGYKDALKSKGFVGVKDINDIKYSGYNTKSARILFNKENVDITKEHILKADELAKEGAKAQLMVNGEAYLQTILPVVGGVSGAATISNTYKEGKTTSKMNKNEKLTDTERRHLRALKNNNNMSVSALAKRYGVSESTIRYYLNG